MSTSYSLDLRTKVITALKNGSLQRNVAKRFKISLSTVKRYWKLYKENGDIKPKKRVNSWKRKVNYDEVIFFVKNNSDKTLQEIGENFKITARSVFYILRAMNFTFKKSRFYTKKETKTSGQYSLKKSVKSRINN
jgi:transposase